MRLKNYLHEVSGGIIGGGDEGYGVKGRTQEVKYDKALKDMLKDYSDMLQYYSDTRCQTLFMRGLRQKSDSHFALVKPSGHTRQSAYTANYYTLITSEDPSWDHVPSRNQSVIGATDKNKAHGYGSLFVVVPKNGSKIGQAQSEDFWGTFQHAFGDQNYPLGDFNKFLTRIFKKAGVVSPDTSLTELKFGCSEVDAYIKKNLSDETTPFFEMESPEYGWDKWDKIMDKFYDGDMYKALLKIFSPEDGNILVTKAGQPLRDDVEVWTNGDCLMVLYKQFQKYLPDLLSIAKTGQGRFNTQLFDQLKDVKIMSDWRGNIKITKSRGNN